MDPFVGQIIMFGGNFAPRGWAFCDGTQTAATAGASIATPGITNVRTFTATKRFNTSTPDITLNSASAGGNSAAVNNIHPYECVNYIISLQGTYPSRS